MAKYGDPYSEFDALLKGLTSVVVDKVERMLVIHPPTQNSCQTRDSNPQSRVTSLTLYPSSRPRLPQSLY